MGFETLHKLSQGQFSSTPWARGDPRLWEGRPGPLLVSFPLVKGSVPAGTPRGEAKTDCGASDVSTPPTNLQRT